MFWCKLESLVADCHKSKLRIAVTARICVASKTFHELLLLNCFQTGPYVFSAVYKPMKLGQLEQYMSLGFCIFFHLV